MGSWHELDTTTSFVMYYIYNNGLGEGKLKCTVSVFCDFTNYWFVYTKRNIRMQNIARGTEEPFFWGGGRGEQTKKIPGNTIIGF